MQVIGVSPGIVWADFLDFLNVALHLLEVGVLEQPVLLEKGAGANVPEYEVRDTLQRIVLIICVSVDLVALLLMNHDENIGLELFMKRLGLSQDTTLRYVKGIILVARLAGACGRANGVVARELLLSFLAGCTASSSVLDSLVSTGVFLVWLRHLEF